MSLPGVFFSWGAFTVDNNFQDQEGEKGGGRHLNIN